MSPRRKRKEPAKAPPKRVSAEVREHDRESTRRDGLPALRTPERGLRRRGPAGMQIDPESLPVLAAFQDFLESERRRTRNRILALTALVVLVLLGFIGGGLLVGTVFFDQVAGDVEDVRDDVARLEDATGRWRTDAATALDDFGRKAEALRGELQTGQEKMTSFRTALTNETASTRGELADVREFIQLLEPKNMDLTKDLTDLRLRMADVMERVASGAAVPAPVEVTRAPMLAAAAPAAEPLRGPIVLRIVPPGSDAPTEWRVPIPE